MVGAPSAPVSKAMIIPDLLVETGELSDIYSSVSKRLNQSGPLLWEIGALDAQLDLRTGGAGPPQPS